ncbi:ATP-binding response regulator [Ideonella paludis]|uniref:histidine kinase n=2 Tax=Ideonella paludis TaxID=1233411 RepID=A0ABS5E360_9BURK|nr:HAMP domain-containing sensor histidine kinase [Ideonella paludis]MBQ0937807.1 hypothetical protein [Ideonella paludis]
MKRLSDFEIAKSLPLPFENEVESDFQAFHAAEWATRRSATSLLAGCAWIFFGFWDLYFAHQRDAVTFNNIYFCIIPWVAGVLILLFRTFALERQNVFNSPKLVEKWILITVCGSAVAQLVRFRFLQFDEQWIGLYFGMMLQVTFAFSMLGLLRRATLISSIIFLSCSIALIIAIQFHRPNPLIGTEAAVTMYCLIVMVTFLCVLTSFLLEVQARSTFLSQKGLREKILIEEQSAEQLKFINRELNEAKIMSEERLATVLALQLKIEEDAHKQDIDRLDFLSGAVHDLRQPVQVMLSMRLPINKLLRDGDLSRGAECLTLVWRAADSLKNQLGALLNIAQLERGALLPALGSYNLKQLVDEVIEMYSAEANLQNVILQIRSETDSITGYTDESFLKRILGNLIENSIKYKKIQTGEQSWVKISLQVHLDEFCKIEVADNGVGIDENDIRNGVIFSPFIRGSSYVQANGFGVGLAIVKKMIELLPDHSISFTSNRNFGTAASIILRSGVKFASRSMPKNMDEVSSDTGDLVILIIEDDDLVLRSLIVLLESNGYRTISANNIERLAEVIEYMDKCPDLFIADYQIGAIHDVGDAFSILPDSWKNIPSIIITGDTSPEFIEGKYTNSLVLKKPVDGERILFEIGKIFRVSEV